ncbi:MAG: hypothetical protein KJ949_03060, partial [Nanoarchaeota archaeon]|nr:hypothetical protein [Nanoarchaeota archaeon]
MKKININFLVLGVVFLTLLGMVSATDGVDFVNPTAGQSVSETLNVEWTNTQSITQLTLQDRIGSDCNSLTNWTDLTTISGSSPTTYSWNTLG